LDELESKVPALLVAELSQALLESHPDRRRSLDKGNRTQAQRPRRWLGTRGKGPSGRAAEHCDKLATLH
jgi:hypothetical protein